jgi:PASTA domain
MACESLQQQLSQLLAAQDNLREQVFTPAQAQQHAAALAAIAVQVTAATAALSACLAQAATTLVPQPQRILEIVNTQSAAFIQQAIAARDELTISLEPGNRSPPPAISLNTFPKDVAVEWIQPLAPNTEYDTTIVAATGWAVHPRRVDTDFPFSHPFGTDWEFSLALDGTNADGTGPFDFLLSRGNPADPAVKDERSEDETAATALKLSFPRGLLGVEMDGNNIPTQFTDFVQPGSRMAVYGRWIVDCGHPIHRCEIHPPLIMAAASNPDTVTTGVLFTSRPYLMGETYTTDESSVYNDSDTNASTFYTHLAHEIEKLPVASTMVEAHPKVKSAPFVGKQVANFLIRPPALPQGVSPASLKLNVSFNFVVRSGCTVGVTSSGSDTINVSVVMDQAGYKPPSLPAKAHRTFTPDDLVREDPDVASDIVTAKHDAEGLGAAEGFVLAGALGAGIGAAASDWFISHGIETDAYASLESFDIESEEGAVLNASASVIPPHAGIAVNDSQPYPVYGWLKVSWVDLRQVAASTLIDLNGTWAVGGVPGPIIASDGHTLSIDMSSIHRPNAIGVVVLPSLISVTFPDDQTYKATLTPPNTILWSNNSTWTKVTSPSPPPPPPPPPPPITTVPDVSGMAATLASKVLIASGLVAQFSGPNTAKSWVFSQSPSAGARVAPGSVVKMVLSTAPQR